MHGVPVFRGTRVPVQTLFDYLEGDETLENFRLLIDECVDERLRRLFPGYDCQTARFANLAGLSSLSKQCVVVCYSKNGSFGCAAAPA